MNKTSRESKVIEWTLVINACEPGEKEEIGGNVSEEVGQVERAVKDEEVEESKEEIGELGDLS